MTRIGLLLIACLLAGCGPSRTPEGMTPGSPMLVNIKSIVAEQLGLKPADVNPELTFAAVGADELDLVEITMEVEDRFDIAISDEALVDAAGMKDAGSLCDHLTIQSFATVAEKSPQQPKQKPSPIADDGMLHESQVGAFGELSQLRDPNRLVLVFIPSFEELIKMQEQRLGRKLAHAEIETLRQKAAVIALPQEMADKMEQYKMERNASRRQQ